MKLYESAYTYLPFLYLFVVSTTFAALYHGEGDLKNYRPFTVLSFLLLNTYIQFRFKTENFIKNIIHRHVWQTVTLGIYSILFNSVHEMIFEEFHFQSTHVNYTVSILYLAAVMISCYYYRRISFLLYCHIIALYFPILRYWQINLYIYVIYIALNVFIVFSKVDDESLIDSTIYRNPIIKYFIYLRINDTFILFGLIQLYIDYYSLFVLKPLEDIENIIKEQKRKYKSQNWLDDNGI